MPKLQLLCPFSKKACRECGIFRGRHLSLCHYPQYQDNLWNKDDLTASPQNVKKPKAAINNTRFEFPELFEIPPRRTSLED